MTERFVDGCHPTGKAFCSFTSHKVGVLVFVVGNSIWVYCTFISFNYRYPAKNLRSNFPLFQQLRVVKILDHLAGPNTIT